jgi:hypothetical protein
MAPIMRHQPGGIAPACGVYRLVGHYGEGTDLAVWCDRGEEFPTITVGNADIGPLWYVQVYEANELARVA